MTTQPSPSDYLQLSSASYFAVGGTPVAPQGWTVLIPPETNSNSGMQAVAFQNNLTHTIVISYEGTNITSGMSRAQGEADIAIALGNTPQANLDALAFAQRVALLAGNNQIFVTGHSLGGEEAEYVQANSSFILGGIAGGAAFGAPGVPGISEGIAYNSFVSYIDVNDPIGNSGTHVGTLEYLGTKDSLWNSTPLTEALMDVQYHLLSNYAKDLNDVNNLSCQSTASLGAMDVAFLGGASFFDALQASQYQYQSNSLLGSGATLSADGNSVTLSFASGQSGSIFLGSGATVNVVTGNSFIDAGNANTINAANATVIVVGDKQTTVIGNNNQIDIGGNGSTVVSGVSNIIRGDTNVRVTVSGSTNDVFLGAGSVLTDNLSDGTSQMEFFNPTAIISSEIKNFLGLNGTGADTENLINLGVYPDLSTKFSIFFNNLTFPHF